MKYLLLCPKESLKAFKELIKACDGIWNGIGYAFPIVMRPLIEAWMKDKAKIALIEVPYDGSWEDYKEECKEDWEYLRLTQLKYEKYILERALDETI